MKGKLFSLKLGAKWNKITKESEVSKKRALSTFSFFKNSSKNSFFSFFSSNSLQKRLKSESIPSFRFVSSPFSRENQNSLKRTQKTKITPMRTLSTSTKEETKGDYEGKWEEEKKVSDEEDKNRKKVGKWLMVVGGMTFVMVVLGGWTRLTESGLSMVEWKLVKEVVPPLTNKEWQESFEKYKKFPEYQQRKSEMDLQKYKEIYFWEWAHRVWGRVIGISFAAPLVYFFLRGNLKKREMGKMSVLLVLGGMQGLIGWWMVKSGLDQKILEEKRVATVSHYRLAVHLGSAFFLYSCLFWFSLDFLKNSNQVFKRTAESVPTTNSSKIANVLSSKKVLQIPLRSLKRFGVWNVGVVMLTAVSGALVAGMDAGLIYNEFPQMGGQWIPEDILSMQPLHLNFLQNSTTLQFNHRILGITTFSSVLLLWIYSRRFPLPNSTKKLMNATLIVACLQVGLGISTLLSFVDIRIAASHQSGSLTLLTFVLWLLHDLKRIRIPI